MAGTTRPLTNTEVLRAKAVEKDMTLHNGDGLFLIVKTSGKKLWRFHYQRPNTKHRTVIGLGAIPALSLGNVCILRADYLALLANGINPLVQAEVAEEHQQLTQDNIFSIVVANRFQLKSKSVTPDYAKDIWRPLAKDFFPAFGQNPVQKIKARALVEALESIKARGALETVRRLVQRINEIMIYAANTGLIDANPVSGIGMAFEKPKKQNMPTLRPEESPNLMKSLIFSKLSVSTKCLIEWQLLTHVHPFEALGTLWKEIDFDLGAWTISAERMKRKREHLFPSRNAPKKTMNSQTANAALKHIVYSGKLVAHELRSIACTAMNEAEFNANIIETALAHNDENEVRRAYNRSVYLAKRECFMQRWGDLVYSFDACQNTKGNKKMKLNADRNKLFNNPEAGRLFSILNELNQEQKLHLQESELYYDFPLYKDDEDKLVISPLMLVSRLYGIVIFYLSDCHDRDAESTLQENDSLLENIYSQIYSRLLKQKSLRKNKRELNISVESAIFAPYVDAAKEYETESDVIVSKASIERFIEQFENLIDENIYSEAASTIEGGKGLIRVKQRDTDGFSEESKVKIISKIESSIARFDSNQLGSCVNEVDGIERIRGLAGSGKTVVLAMKVAITHLRHPDKKILYTFSTKALYQHVKRLITRFYRQFNDLDPDFENAIYILHAWGGGNAAGVYYNACQNNSARFINFGEAQRNAPKEPFSYACRQLLENHSVKQQYDYVFVDEAQDFDSPFLQLCLKLTRDDKMVFGLDVFQNIFQTTAPTIEEILGEGKNLTLDKFLNSCYRTPCATLVCAHAVGLGVYGNPVQAIRTVEDWTNLGYQVEGQYGERFVSGEKISVLRTEETSPTLYNEDKEKLIITQDHGDIASECKWVAEKIKSDIIDEGLNASDILVVCADDKHYKNYYNQLSFYLSEKNIDVNNVNADKYNISDFSIDNKVTYSTIHKAKGNEGYSVYIIGSECLYHNPNVKNRNLLFTAMTRTKGWLAMTGIGYAAVELFDEIKQAKENVPYLKFNYPSGEMLDQIEVDLHRFALDESPEDFQKLLDMHGIDGLKAMLREYEAKKVKKS